MATETVLIEFVTNDEQLKSSEERLTNLGKVEKSNADQFKAANTEINKQVTALKNLDATAAVINKSGTNLKKTIADVSASVKGMSASFQKEFKQGAVEALKAAGVSAEQFEAALEGVEGQTVSLRSQLRNMTQALTQMKVEGKDNTEQYRALAMQAGQLKDAINDANQEIKNFGSDTSTFDGLIGAVQGLAGGFAVVQGASALFGDESEELQKTLLRVNAAMAILQGLQQIQVVLQKESAAATLANTIATKAQTAAQVAFNFVVGTSTGLLKAFRIALAATGVGLLIIGIMELVSALDLFGDSAEDSTKEADAFAAALDNIANSTSDATDEINRQTDLVIANLEKSGAKESQINSERIKNIEDRRAAEIAAGEAIAQRTIELNRKTRDGLINEDDYKKTYDAIEQASDQHNKRMIDLDNEFNVAVVNNQKTIQDEQKAAFEEAKKRAEEAAAKARELRAAQFADFKAGVELELLAAEEGGQAQLEIRKRLLRAILQIELDNQKLTENQRKLLVQQFFKDRLELEKDFNKQRDAITFANIAAGIQADLAQLEVSQERKLELIINGIRVQAELERAAAEGNAAKIAEIEARRDKAIRDAKIASIQEVADYEIRLSAATNGPAQRRLKQIASDADQEIGIRIDAIQQVAIAETQAIARRIQALNEEKEKKLISQRDYDLQYAELVDQQTKIWEDAEKAKTDATKAEGEKRKQQTIKEIQDIVAVAQEVIAVLESLYSVQSQAEENRLNEQKQRLKDLVEAGAITEKEAITRQKRLDAEERKIKNQQAQRDKQVAVFRALLAIPQAILQGLSQGGPILAAIYGALASVQAGLVIARPIPKFGKGKKNRYEGLAEVGETGAELIQRGNKMYVAPKRTITYLKASDKVFNPMETAAMLTKAQLNTEQVAGVPVNGKGFAIDYDKLGESVGKHVSTTVQVDGVTAEVIKRNYFEKWLNNRRSL